ncbi:MAG: hypothetical protein QM677_07165 [Microbacterium sp.]
MGSVPDWVVAVVTLLALLAAVWAGVTSKRLVDVENKRDAAAEARRVREQASRISAWMVLTWERAEDARGRDAARRSTKGIVLHNGSTAPVYRVAVESRMSSGVPARPVSLTVLPPGTFAVLADPAREFGWHHLTALDEAGEVVRPVAAGERLAVTALEFTDAHNVRWRRTETGLEPA